MTVPPPLETPLADPAQFRLLVAFDALLVEGSVGRAAARMGLSTPAMSRMLKQLRSHYGDPLFERTGTGMIPTPFAEELRLRLRALVSEANALLAPRPAKAAPLTPHPPLSLDEAAPFGGGPDAAMLSRRLARASASPEGSARLSGYVAMIGNAAGRTRPMTEEEAEDAFGIALRDEAHPIQLGGLLVALQSRGVTEAELAGFTRAARASFDGPPPGSGPVDLDWPAYLSPRAQGAPWFLLSARLVARAGYRVLVHGTAEGLVHRAFLHAGLSVAPARQERLCFLPVEGFAPEVGRMRAVRRLIQMPTAAQFVLALLNPEGARVSLLGQRQLGRPGLQRDVMHRLGWPEGFVLNGLRDVAQALPDGVQHLFCLRHGATWDEDLPRLAVSRAEQTRAATPEFNRLEYWQAVWDGEVTDPMAEAIVRETAAVALRAVDARLTPDAAREMAQRLWQERRPGARSTGSGGPAPTPRATDPAGGD